MPSTPPPCTLNSTPIKGPVTIHHLRRGVGVRGGVSRGFQGGREGWNKSLLTECKGG